MLRSGVATALWSPRLVALELEASVREWPFR